MNNQIHPLAIKNIKMPSISAKNNKILPLPTNNKKILQ